MTENHPWGDHCQYFYIALVFLALVLMVFCCLVLVSENYKAKLAEWESKGVCHIAYFDYAGNYDLGG